MPQASKETTKSRSQTQVEARAEPTPQPDARTTPAPQSDARAEKNSQPGAAAGEAASMTSSESAPDATSAFGFVPFESLAPLQQAQIEAMVTINNRLIEGLREINREVVAFTDKRARALLEGARSMPKTADLNDIWSFQIDYASAATEAYVEEATRLLELGVKVSQECWSPFQESMTSAFSTAQRKND